MASRAPPLLCTTVDGGEAATVKRPGCDGGAYTEADALVAWHAILLSRASDHSAQLRNLSPGRSECDVSSSTDYDCSTARNSSSGGGCSLRGCTNHIATPLTFLWGLSSRVSARTARPRYDHDMMLPRAAAPAVAPPPKIEVTADWGRALIDPPSDDEHNILLGTKRSSDNSNSTNSIKTAARPEDSPPKEVKSPPDAGPPELFSHLVDAVLHACPPNGAETEKKDERARKRTAQTLAAECAKYYEEALRVNHTTLPWGVAYPPPPFGTGSSITAETHRLTRWLATWRPDAVTTAEPGDPSIATTADDANNATTTSPLSDILSPEAVAEIASDPDLTFLFDERGNRQSIRAARREAMLRMEAEREEQEREKCKGYLKAKEQDAVAGAVGTQSNIIVIQGPSGIGKTAAVYIAAERAGYRVFEINSSMKRCPRALERVFFEATRCRQIEVSKGSAAAVHCELAAMEPTDCDVEIVSMPQAEKAQTATPPTIASKSSRKQKAEDPKKRNAISKSAVEAFFFKKPIAPTQPKSDTAAPLNVAEKQIITVDDSDNPKAKRKPSTSSSSKGLEKQKQQQSTATADTSPATTDRTSHAEQQQQQPFPLRRTALVLAESADVVFEDERGMCHTLRKMAQQSKFPVVVTAECPDESEGFSEFGSKVPRITLSHPSLPHAVLQLAVVLCARSGLPPREIAALQVHVERCVAALLVVNGLPARRCCSHPHLLVGTSSECTPLSLPVLLDALARSIISFCSALRRLDARALLNQLQFACLSLVAPSQPHLDDGTTTTAGGNTNHCTRIPENDHRVSFSPGARRTRDDSAIDSANGADDDGEGSVKKKLKTESSSPPDAAAADESQGFIAEYEVHRLMFASLCVERTKFRDAEALQYECTLPTDHLEHDEYPHLHAAAASPIPPEQVRASRAAEQPASIFAQCFRPMMAVDRAVAPPTSPSTTEAAPQSEAQSPVNNSSTNSAVAANPAPIHCSKLTLPADNYGSASLFSSYFASVHLEYAPVLPDDLDRLQTLAAVGAPEYRDAAVCALAGEQLDDEDEARWKTYTKLEGIAATRRRFISRWSLRFAATRCTEELTDFIWGLRALPAKTMK